MEFNGEKPLQNKRNRLVSATQNKESIKQCVRAHDPEQRTAPTPPGRLSSGNTFPIS